MSTPGLEERLRAAEQRLRELEQESRPQRTDTHATEQTLKRANATLKQQASGRERELEASIARLAETEQRFHLLVDAVTDYAIFMLDAHGIVSSWNRGAERIKGYAPEEIVGQHFSRFYTEEDRVAGVPAKALSTAALTGKFEAEGWRVRKGGKRFWASVIINAVHDAEGHLVGFAKVTRDLTERRNAEEQLRQAQKMEAVGQLTGGVAHDFNNMLQVIMGNINLLQRRLAKRDPDAVALADSAQRGAERAALLVHRLLAFSRRQALEPRPVSVNTLISGMSDMLRRTLGEGVLVETVLAAGLWPIFVDPNQLENSLLNLAINARDAMPNGGKLTIEAANVFLDEEYARGADIPPGQYVGIFVSDNGVGMTRDVVAQAFDPFFTTKGMGQGTGLGLSQVYGFVRQSDGHVRIYSEPGSGTSVKVYLPRHAGDAGVEAPSVPAAPPRGRGEVILAVEDDADVRRFTVQLLRDLGYTVLEAADGREALRALDLHPEIRLLFTDVGLPGGMNGRQLADKAKRGRPDLKVLFTSGYARNAMVHHGRLDPGVELIGKPFTFPALAAKIRAMLDAG